MIENPNRHRGSAKVLRRAARSVRTTVERRTTLGTRQVQPARGISTFVSDTLGRPCRHRVVAPNQITTVVPRHSEGPRPGGGEEVDPEADRAERAHLVVDFGRDRLGGTRSELDLDRRLARHRKAQPPLVQDDPTPGALPEAVRSAKPSWHGVLIPLRAGANETEIVWGLGPVTQRAMKLGPEPGCALFVVGHPGSQLEWGAVPDMLGVATRQLCHPVAFVVLVKAGDRSLHRAQPTYGSPITAVTPARCVTTGWPRPDEPSGREDERAGS